MRGLSTGGEGDLPAGYNVIGVLFYGSEGWLALNSVGFKVYKGRGMASEKIMEERVPKSANFDTGTPIHMENFLSAVRSRNYHDLNSDIEVGVTSANLVHLANASYRLKRELNRGEIDTDTELKSYLTREYRAPYIVPDKV